MKNKDKIQAAITSLEMIRDLKSPVLNPDGENQYEETIRLIAKETIDVLQQSKCKCKECKCEKGND